MQKQRITILNTLPPKSTYYVLGYNLRRHCCNIDMTANLYKKIILSYYVAIFHDNTCDKKLESWQAWIIIKCIFKSGN